MVNACNKIVDKGKKIAAHLMEAAEADIEFKDGQFTRRRHRQVGRHRPGRVHRLRAAQLPAGRRARARGDRRSSTRRTSPIPSGTYVCELEVDPATGVVEILKFVAVDDFGNVVNPMIVEGQVHGGLVQGIGQALLESAVYDEGGQLLTGSYMDYTMPRADNVPSFEVVTSAGTRLHRELAGREGLRRGGRDRLAAGGDQRHHQRHRRAGRDAGDAREGLARHPGHQAARRRPNSSRDGTGMYDFNYHRPSQRRGRRVPARRRTRTRKLLAGGQTYLPTLKQRLAQPARPDRPRRHRRAQGDQGGGRRHHHRRHDPARRRGELGGRQAGRSRRWRRWPS